LGRNVLNPELFKIGSQLGCLAAALKMSKSVLIDLLRFIEEIPSEDVALKSSLIFVKRMELRGVMKSEWISFFSSMVKDLSYKKRAKAKLISILRIAILIHKVLGTGVSAEICKDLDMNKLLSYLSG